MSGFPRLITEATSTARPIAVVRHRRTGAAEGVGAEGDAEGGADAAGGATDAPAEEPSPDSDGDDGATLFLGSAVCSNSYHLLHHLGVTHIVNVTEPDEVHAPPEEEGFVFLRCPVKDTEDQDTAPLVEAATGFVAEAIGAGRSVLVHW